MSSQNWTPQKTEKIFGKKNLFLPPHEHTHFWKTIGLIHKDDTINSDQVKKLLQVNHMLSLVMPPLEKIQKSMPDSTLNFIDVGCGKSYLSLALSYFTSLPISLVKLPQIFGFDTNANVIKSSNEASTALGLTARTFFHNETASVAKVPNQRVHAVIALHACDTATDEALAFGISNKADFIAVAPCCQAELCSILNKPTQEQKNTALRAVLTSPQLLREASATWTDALRMAFLGSRGYEVVATEFVPSSHTPKNRLISARKIAAHSPLKLTEFEDLKTLLGSVELKLEKLILEHS
jgi:hypothetical protein